MKKTKGGLDKQPRAAQTAFEKAALAAGLKAEAGKSAVEGKYRAIIAAKQAKATFTGSVDMDGSFKPSEPKANRWDYGLGLAEPGQPERAVWVEPHSGDSAGEVKKVLAKLDWLEAKLALKEFAKLKCLTEQTRKLGKPRFHWLSSGQVGIRAGSREANMLAVRGMNPPSSHLEI